jgi:hypothetical protein
VHNLNYTPVTLGYKVKRNYVWWHVNKKKLSTTALDYLWIPLDLLLNAYIGLIPIEQRGRSVTLTNYPSSSAGAKNSEAIPPLRHVSPWNNA